MIRGSPFGFFFFLSFSFSPGTAVTEPSESDAKSSGGFPSSKAANAASIFRSSCPGLVLRHRAEQYLTSCDAWVLREPDVVSIIHIIC